MVKRVSIAYGYDEEIGNAISEIERNINSFLDDGYELDGPLTHTVGGDFHFLVQRVVLSVPDTEENSDENFKH